MKFKTHNKHVIDLLFPIALFFVFAASSLVVLILAANVYGSTTDELLANDESRTILSYLSEKIRQNDTDGALSVTTIDGTQCLAMSVRYNDVPYTTYIYEYNGMLKELFARDDADVSLKNGQDIMAVSSLSMTQLERGLYRFATVDSRGRESFLIASERSVR